MCAFFDIYTNLKKIRKKLEVEEVKSTEAAEPEQSGELDLFGSLGN
jgi:hypothetical protein